MPTRLLLQHGSKVKKCAKFVKPGQIFLDKIHEVKFMGFTTSVNAIRKAEGQLEDVARRLANPPATTPATSTTYAPKDTVELSAEAVVLLLSRNAVAASVAVINTENGVGQSLLTLLD